MAAHAEPFGLDFGVLLFVCLVLFYLLVVVVCCSFGFGVVWFFCFWCFRFFWLWLLDLSTWAGDAKSWALSLKLPNPKHPIRNTKYTAHYAKRRKYF